MLVTAALGFGALAAIGPGCAPSTPAGAGGAADCLSNPFVCQSNQTCWPNDQVTRFMCIATPTTKKTGDPCDFIGGQVVCPPAHVCIVQGTNAGVCTPYCDASHPCPDFATCEDYMIAGPTGENFDVHACDAVTISKAGSTSSSSSTGATSSSSSGG